MATTADVRSLPLASLFAGASVRADAAELAAARRHEVDLLLFARLLREQPEALTGRDQAEAVEALRAAAARNRRLLDELLGVLGHLDAAGTPALAFKGPALALLLYDDLRVRRCFDLDLLVPEERIDAALGMLQANGYRASPRADGLSRKVRLLHEAKGLALGLHWNIVGGETPFAFDFDQLWAERGLIPCGEVALPVPPPEWLVVATCLDLIKGYPRPELVYLADLQRLLARFPDLDWDRVAAIAAATGTRRICALGLALVGDLAAVAPPPPARERFSADAATRAAVERVRRALADARREERVRYRHRLRNILAHAAFRERPADKLRVCRALASFLIRPDGEDVATAGRGGPWLRRAARLPALAASLLRGAPRPSVPGPGAALAGEPPRPAPGTTFHALDDAGVLFSQATQTIYALSPSAAFLWCCFEEGRSVDLVVSRYADASGRPPRLARADVAAMLQTWRTTGLLDVPRTPDAAPPSADAGTRAPAPAADRVVPAAPPVRRRYRLLEGVFEVGFPSEALCRAVDPALRHLATAARPDAMIAVVRDADGFTVLIDGAPFDRCETIDELAPLVKGSVAAAAANRRDFAFFLHAAMLRRSGAALLLPAAPGSGKTCLTAALARAGFAYHTDEITLLERGTLEARGAPVALTVKDGGWPVLEPLYPEIAGLPAHHRVDGKIVRYLPPPVDAADPAQERPYPVRWIVFPRYTAAGPNRIERVPRVEAMRLLFDECLALRLTLDAKEVQALVDWLAGIECHALAFNDLRAAVRLVEGVCARP